jgi:hypothetical protein
MKKSNGIVLSKSSKWLMTSLKPYRVNFPGTVIGDGGTTYFGFGMDVTNVAVIWTSSAFVVVIGADVMIV